MLNSRNIGLAVLFLATVGAINAGMAAWYRHATEKTRWTTATEHEFHTVEGSTQTFILGDSHAKCGVDPRLMDKSFNLATLGASYLHTYSRLKALLDDKTVSLRRVLLPMDTHSLAWQQSRMEDVAYWAHYVDYGTLTLKTGNLGYFGRRFLLGDGFPYLGQGDVMLAWLVGRGKTTTPYPMIKGYIELPGDWAHVTVSERVRQARNEAAFLHDNYHCLNPFMIACFNKAVALCEAKHIQIVLVRYPVTKQMLTCIEQNVPLDKLQDFYDTVAADHPDIIRLNFIDLLADDPACFADADHLNPRGAKRFTRQLKTKLAAQ